MINNIKYIYHNYREKYREYVLTQAEKLLRKLEQLFADYSLIGNATFFNPEEYDWVRNLETNWQIIRQELDNLLLNIDDIPNFQDISTDQYSITQDNRWKTYFFYAYGLKAESNCQKCPQTIRLIKKIPQIKTAFFSILLPQKHIPQHCGPYKGVIRYHLALKVPQDYQNCAIKVGDDIRHWQEGKSLMFDDTFSHEAWNKTEEIRVVLFVDVVRPMGFPLSLLNQIILKLIAISPYIQSAKYNFQKWERKLNNK
jgi:beta-hydroxylase